jgi:pimeloyl-ACP methyl ester carboxylesterase
VTAREFFALGPGDCRLACEEQGAGPPILWVMGFTGSRYQWKGFPARLADRFRILTFDNRGVGASDAPPGPYDTAIMARDALAVLDAAGVERASVVGVSMGGMIAQQIALAAPHRVDRLVLGCTSYGNSVELFSTLGSLWGTRSARGPVDRLRLLVELNFSDAFLREQPGITEDLITHGLRHKMTPAGFQGQLGALANHDTRARLGEIRCPTLVVTGDQDRLMAPSLSSALVAALPEAQLRLLPGAGHMFWIERASEFEGMLREFFEVEGAMART